MNKQMAATALFHILELAAGLKRYQQVAIGMFSTS
jgi:hypothetical protein